MLLMLSGCAFSNGSETTTSCSHEGEEDDGTAEQQDVGSLMDCGLALGGAR